MVSRRQRIKVVFDTNVFVRALKTRSKASANQRVFRLWLLEKRLQLAACADLIDEYLGVFRDALRLKEKLLAAWHRRWTADSRTTVVNLGLRFTQSRGTDDNLLLATALAGRAAFVITNDRDLLELPLDVSGLLAFKVVTPFALLPEMERGV